MEFRLNRNNQIMNVELMMDTQGKTLTFHKLKVASSGIPEMEAILNGEKTPDENSAIMLEEMEMSEEDYKVFAKEEMVSMKAAALTFAERYIYCFDLVFGKLTVEKIGNKKKTEDKMILKNVKIKLWPDGEYSAREVSGLADQMNQGSEVEVSIPTGDHLTSVQI